MSILNGNYWYRKCSQTRGIAYLYCIKKALEFNQFKKKSLSNLHSYWYINSWRLLCFFFKTGFGNLSPRTWCGQLFCVCYALVGIPMFGILLAGVGDHMGTVLRRAVAKIETLFLVRMVCPAQEPNLQLDLHVSESQLQPYKAPTSFLLLS